LNKLLLLLIGLIVISSSLTAQNNKSSIPWADGRSSAEDLQISLITFSPGELLTDWWGHTTLLVKDTINRVSRVYNFGYFSFDDGFINRFAMGRLIFWAGDVSLASTLKRYVSANRTIAIQELNIPVEMRLSLAQDLAKAVLPENSSYLYHHYNENCATRLRDYIDDASYGQFAESMKVAGRLTFREHTLRYTAHQPLMQWLLMFLMNDSIDKPIQNWDEMFLPDELSKYVSDFSYSDSLGTKTSLVAKSYIYYDSNKKPVPFETSNKPLWAIFVGLFFGGLAIVLGWLASNGKRALRVLFLLYNSVLSLIFGFIGTVLFFMSLFTDHFVTHGNENLFLANPLTLLIFFITLILFFKNTEELWKKIRVLWLVVAISSTLILFLKIFPIFDQDNLMILFILFPINLGFAAGHFYYQRGK